MLKTIPNKKDIISFLNEIEDTQKRKDCFQVLKWMQEITKEKAIMWGNSIVGFGSYHYIYDSGSEGDWFLTGFSPRKQNISFYIMTGFTNYPELLKKLGKFKTGKGCLYIKKLEDVDPQVLKELIRKSVENLKAKYPG